MQTAARARAPPPPPGAPPAKRRRVAPASLQTLPQPPLRRILAHLHAGPHTVSSLRALAPLRTVCASLRDAVDAHVTSLDASAVPPPRVAQLAAALPRFPLAHLTLPPHLVAAHTLPVWRALFARRDFPRLRALTFVSPDTRSPVAALFADALAPTLETLSTTSPALLAALAARPTHVHTVELLMDGVDPRLLARLPARRLRLLFRQGLTPPAADALVAALRAIPTLACVHLRVNALPSTLFPVLPRVPHLRRLSLFDGAILPAHRGATSIAQCPELDELQLEWMRGLSGHDVAVVARGLGTRLRRLRIWNCDAVCDDGLVSVARYCPTAEVELRFVRDQFGPHALAAFGDRVSWASSM